MNPITEPPQILNWAAFIELLYHIYSASIFNQIHNSFGRIWVAMHTDVVGRMFKIMEIKNDFTWEFQLFTQK